MKANVNLTIGQEITFANAYGVNIITEIKGNMATTLEKKYRNGIQKKIK